MLYEAVGGILEPEKTIQAHVTVAQYHGAQVKTNEQVTVLHEQIQSVPLIIMRQGHHPATERR